MYGPFKKVKAINKTLIFKERTKAKYLENYLNFFVELLLWFY